MSDEFKKCLTYRLLARQQEKLKELFCYYANYLAVDEIYPKKQIILEEARCNDGYWSTKKAFYSIIIINLYILFCEEKGKTHYSRLIKTNNESLKNIINTELKIYTVENLEEYLLRKSNTRKEIIQSEKKRIRKYRDKILAHGDDYSPEMANKPETKIIFPELPNLIKYAFAFFSFIDRILAKDITNDEVTFIVDTLNSQITFDSCIQKCRENFTIFWGCSQFRF